MHSSPKSSARLAVISIGLLLILCNPTGADEPQKAQPSIKELKQKRLEKLLLISEARKRLFEKASVDYAVVHASERELFAARLEYAESQEDRIKACDLAIEDVRRLQGIIQAQKESGQATGFALLQAQEFELQAQIARANAEDEAKK
jgi:hypothetical protein